MSLNINSNNIISSNWVKLLGIKIDSRLDFAPHVSDLCKSAARQLNALFRLKSDLYLTFEERKILIDSFVYSNFSYFPLVWNFASAKATNKIASIQKRVLRFLFDNYESSYETLLMKAKKPTITVHRLRYLCAEIYRTVNSK